MRLLTLIAVLSVGCTATPQRNGVLDSPVVPFNELFAPADTFRLDPSVIIGHISFLDVNQEGYFLVTDAIGRSVNLFSPSGKHVRAYSIPECLPDLGNIQPFSSRFLDPGYVVVMGLGGVGAVAVFNTEGRCVGATRGLSVPSLGFCTSNDSIFFLGIPLPANRNNHVAVFTPALHHLHSLPVESPKFPVLNAGRLGIPGRNVDCFDDGPYYTYLGSTDAIPARRAAEYTQQRPQFFEQRPQDLLSTVSREARRVEANKYLITDGVFALNRLTRMVVYSNLDNRWQPEALEDTRIRRGISVASNAEQFLPRSTISSFRPVAAGYGYAYRRGNHELLPDGDVGNPQILRYRFIPPDSESADD